MDGAYPSQQEQKLQDFRIACELLTEEPTSGKKFFELKDDVIERFEKLGENLDYTSIMLRAPQKEKFSRHMFFADLICRRNKQLGRFPQKTVYLGNDKTASMLSRRAFDLPFFVYHYGESLIDNIHKSEHEYSPLKLENAMKTHTAVITNSYACIREEGREILKIHNPMQVENETETNTDDCTIIHRSNVGFYCASSKNKIQISLNSTATTMKVKKSRIYKNGEKTEVIVLFDGHFMATGEFVTKDNKLVCELEELPGTYGTSDFEVSPDCKSMIRTCNVLLRRNEETKSRREKIEEEQRKLERLCGTLTLKYVANSEPVHGHGRLIEILCPNLDLLNRLCVSFRDPSFRHEELPSKWSPRERMVYWTHTLSLQKSKETPCRITQKCRIVKEFLRNIDRYSKEKIQKLSDDDFYELCLQLRLAAHALWCVLVPDEKEPHHIVQEEHYKELDILAMSRFEHLYQVPLHDLITFARGCSLDTGIVDCIVEIMASRATPADCYKIIDGYRHAPNTVMQVMKDNSWLMLFGVQYLSPPMEFLIPFLEWLDEKLIEQYSLRKENVSIAFPDPFFRVPQLPLKRKERSLERQEKTQNFSDSVHQGPPKRNTWRDMYSETPEPSAFREGSVVHSFVNGIPRQEAEPTCDAEEPWMMMMTIMRETTGHKNVGVEHVLDHVLPKGNHNDDPALNPQLANREMDE